MKWMRENWHVFGAIAAILLGLALYAYLGNDSSEEVTGDVTQITQNPWDCKQRCKIYEGPLTFEWSREFRLPGGYTTVTLPLDEGGWAEIRPNGPDYDTAVYEKNWKNETFMNGAQVFGRIKRGYDVMFIQVRAKPGSEGKRYAVYLEKL